MTRPVRINVPAGDNSWEGQLNTNLQQIYDRPFPPLLHVGTLANLESTRPAAQYQYCIAIVDYDSAGTPGQHMAFSNGTAWKLASNWELFQRRTFRSTAGAISVADIDDTIITTGGASFAVTIPAISDANEGRVIRIKQNGTGTVTVTPTGGDTIDGAGTKAMDTQYDGFEFISDGTGNWQIMGGSGSGGGGASDFVTLTDTPANYTGAAGKRVVVNSTPDALEFIADTFLTLGDSPANYSSASLKAVRVNVGETALEFYTPAGGVTDFTDLGDVPASYSGEGTKFVRVNSGETALEFVESVASVGQRLKHLTMGFLNADTPQAIGSTETLIDLPTEHSVAGTAITWNDTNDEFEINEDGTYLLMYQVTSDDAAQHNIVAYLKLDTGGGYAIIDMTTSFQGFAVRNQNYAQTVMPLSAGDTVQLFSRDLSSVTPNAREGTSVTIIKMEVSIGPGGDAEAFTVGFEAAESQSIGDAYEIVDFPSPVLNNATDIYTWNGTNFDLTVNEAGTYMVTYRIVAQNGTGTKVDAVLQLDTGGGFADIESSRILAEATGSRSSSEVTTLLELAVGDIVRVRAKEVTGGQAWTALQGSILSATRLKRGSDSIDYSTTAEKTGRRWHNGKEIWRKVFLAAGAHAAGVSSIAHNIPAIDRVVSFTGFLSRDDALHQQIPINYGQIGAEVFGQMDDTNVVFSISAAYTGAGNILSDLEVVIEYTI
jgi:hypothetical protein